MPEIATSEIDAVYHHASSAPYRVIFRIWPDFEIRALLTHSVSTVKADAALTSFAAGGSSVVWAVLDSGVQGDHPHFRKHNTLELDYDRIAAVAAMLDRKLEELVT